MQARAEGSLDGLDGMKRLLTKLVLHHSFPGQGESESAERIAIAARRLGLTVNIVVDPVEIPAFDPDLVLCLSHHEGKTSRYPTYGVMLVPTAWYQASPASLERILSYDGYLTISDTTADWISALTSAFDGKPACIAAYINTLPATPFVPVDISAPKLAYIGGNWDGWRHWELFSSLARRDSLRCYGPVERWRHMEPTAYGGPIPFDGHSALEVYRAAGAGLGIDRADFVEEALPSVRVFEITAAAAAAIVGETPFVRHAFGDTVWSFDSSAPTDVILWQIQRHLAWIAAHPEAAQERMRAAHERFNQNFALERLLPNLLALHHRVMANPRPLALAEDRLAFCHRWWSAQAGRAAQAPEPLVFFQDLRPASPNDDTPPVLGQGHGYAHRIGPWPAALAGHLELHGHIANPRKVLDSALSVLGQITLNIDVGNDAPPHPPLVLELRPDPSASIGDIWRQTLSLEALLLAVPSAAAFGLTLAMAPTPGLEIEIVGLGMRLMIPSQALPLAETAALGAVWIYGAGEGGRRVAEALFRALPRSNPPVLAGFIDDFQTTTLLDRPVCPLAQAAPLMRPDDAVVIASRHWASLWPRLANLPPGRIYTAHPGYGSEVIRLPLWPQRSKGYGDEPIQPFFQTCSNLRIGRFDAGFLLH